MGTFEDIHRMEYGIATKALFEDLNTSLLGKDTSTKGRLPENYFWLVAEDMFKISTIVLLVLVSLFTILALLGVNYGII